MRQLKFRAWNKITKQMVYSDSVGLPDFFSVFTSQSDEWVFMQFSGLLDCDGKEICEGDILEHIESEHVKKEKGFVSFSDGGFLFVKRNRDDMLNSHGGLWCIPKSKIIGNIYENTELLEKI